LLLRASHKHMHATFWYRSQGMHLTDTVGWFLLPDNAVDGWNTQLKRRCASAGCASSAQRPLAGLQSPSRIRLFCRLSCKRMGSVCGQPMRVIFSAH
jgi:hypothetical protein